MPVPATNSPPESSRETACRPRRGEHQTGRRAADVLEVVFDPDPVGGLGDHGDTEEGLAVAAGRGLGVLVAGKLVGHLAEGDGLRLLLPAAVDAEGDLVAGRLVADRLGDITGHGDGGAVDGGDDVVDLHCAVGGCALTDVVDHGLQGASEVVHRRDRRIGLGGREGGGVLPRNLLGVRVGGNDGVQRHDRVVAGEPAAHHLRQRHLRAHCDGGHVEVAGGLIELVGVHPGDVDDRGAVDVTERIVGRPLPLRGEGDGEVDVGAGYGGHAEQSDHHDDRQGADGDGADASATAGDRGAGLGAGGGTTEFHPSHPTVDMFADSARIRALVGRGDAGGAGRLRT